MQDATENCHYRELVGEPMRLELNFSFPLEQFTELVVLGGRRSWVAVDKFCAVGIKIKKDSVFLQQKINRIPQLNYRYRSSSPLEYVQLLTMTLLPLQNTQPSKMQCEHWITIANSCQTLYFAGCLGRKRYSFLKQQYENKRLEPLQSHPNVCGFYTIDAAFHLVKFRQEKNDRSTWC